MTCTNGRRQYDAGLKSSPKMFQRRGTYEDKTQLLERRSVTCNRLGSRLSEVTVTSWRVSLKALPVSV
jgi:hypothetical protein